jgi:hypothetical protein
LANNYSTEVNSLNPKIYYRLNEAAGQADGASVNNTGTEGASYNGTWGSGLAGYPGREAISGEAGPRPTDKINGKPLSGFTTNNLCAGFVWPGSGKADMLSINVGGEGGAPTALDSATQSYTMFFKTSATNNYMRMITTDGPDFTHNFKLIMGAGSGYEGHLVLSVGSDNDQGRYSANSFNDGKWHHLVAIRGSDSRADLKLYIDGKEEVLYNSSGSWTRGYQFRFGTHGTSSNGFTGQMDEIGGWDIALTAKQVQHLFEAAVTMQYGTLIRIQ